MKNFFLPGFLVLVIIFVAMIAFAEVPKTESAGDAAYLAKVDAAIADPAKADWAELRKLYLDTSFFDEHGGIFPVPMLEDFGNRAVASNAPEDIKAFKELFRHHYASIGAHQLAYHLARGKDLSFIDRAAELKALRGIMDVIVKSGNGKKPETAFHTISLDEEYAILRGVLGYEIGKNNSRTINDRIYDLFVVSNASNDTAVMYFDITERMPHARKVMQQQMELAEKQIDADRAAAKAAGKPAPLLEKKPAAPDAPPKPQDDSDSILGPGK